MNHTIAILCETILLLTLAIAATGCRTFNYTEEDLGHERQLIREGMARWGRCGWGMEGSPTIGNIHPNIGNICPGNFGGICPGK